MSPTSNGYGMQEPTAPMIDTNVYLEVLREAEVTKGVNKLVLRSASDWRRLIQIVEERGDELHVLNVCTLLHRLARTLARHPALIGEQSRQLQQTPGWRRLMELVRKHASTCNNMELTNCLWAIATLDMRQEEETVICLLELCVVYLSSFDSRNLALSAWALAKVGCTDRQWAWCKHWADASLDRLSTFDTRDMTMVIWAFATVHWKDEAFLQRFCEEVIVRIDNYGTQDIGNTLWALATLGFRHEGALAALCQHCFPMAEKFDQQALSISMWSLATLGYKHMNVMHHLTQHATERIKTFLSQGMSNIVWACAKFGFQQKCLLMTVAEEAIPRLDEFEPQHMAIMSWAYATLEFPNRPLLTALCKAATRKMDMFGAQHMANMTWAMATLAHKDEEYLRAMVQHALQHAADFNPQECSNLAWALALLTFRDDNLLAALSLRSQEIVAEFIPQNLGNTAWAYNRLGYRDDALMRTLTQQASKVLHECQGQEILDLMEAVGTGGYEQVVDPTAWAIICGWITQRSEGATQFISHSAGIALDWPQLSDFDRALCVQDYRDHLASFSVIGLGYNLTSDFLSGLGVVFPDGAALEAWKRDAQVAAAGARNESDASKNAEAQEGLRACRTVCVYRFSLWNSADTHRSKALEQSPLGVASGQPTDAWELGLVAATLKHHRGGDGEFQALQACSRACVEELGIDPLSGGGAAVEGELWLHVSEVPCLSCVGAMAQFRRLFPNVALHVSFILGRQPAATPSPDPQGSGAAPRSVTVIGGEAAPSHVASSGSFQKKPTTPAPLPSPAEPRRPATASRLASAASAAYAAPSRGVGGPAERGPLPQISMATSAGMPPPRSAADRWAAAAASRRPATEGASPQTAQVSAPSPEVLSQKQAPPTSEHSHAADGYVGELAAVPRAPRQAQSFY